MFWIIMGTAAALGWSGVLAWAGLVEGRRQDRMTRDEAAAAKLYKVEGDGGLKSAA